MPTSNPGKRREIARRHYEKHREKFREAQRLKRARMRAWYHRQKERPCADCGQQFPYYVMDFDHRDGSAKVANVNRLVQDAAWEKVRREIEKCDLVCSNCHRIRTHARMSAKSEPRAKQATS